MKRLIQFGSAFVLLAGVAVPALAQDASSSVESASSAESAMVDYATVISAIETGRIADLATITETSTIDLVLVSDLKANGGADALEDVIAKVGDGAAMLKANVDSNAILSDKIIAAGFKTELVVAVLVNDAGSFTVIVNDEHP